MFFRKQRHKSIHIKVNSVELKQIQLKQEKLEAEKKICIFIIDDKISRNGQFWKF